MLCTLKVALPAKREEEYSWWLRLPAGELCAIPYYGTLTLSRDAAQTALAVLSWAPSEIISERVIQSQPKSRRTIRISG